MFVQKWFNNREDAKSVIYTLLSPVSVPTDRVPTTFGYIDRGDDGIDIVINQFNFSYGTIQILDSVLFIPCTPEIISGTGFVYGTKRLTVHCTTSGAGSPSIPTYVTSDGSVVVCTQVASCEAINRDFTLPALNDVSKCVYFVTNVNSTSITASYGGSAIGTVPAQSMTAFQWYNGAWHKHSLA